MRRDTRDVLAAWTIGTSAMIAACLALTGCGMAAVLTEAEESFTTVERALIDQTARWAGQLGVNVRGYITTTPYVVPNGCTDGMGGYYDCPAVGWYSMGKVFYNREGVADWVRLVPEAGKETAANVSAHEVAHAWFYMHNAEHWCCTLHMGATPTYPFPLVGKPVCDGVAVECLKR